MKKEKLYEAIGDINESYINDAHKTVKKKTNPIWLKWGAMAACFCLMLTAVFLFNSTVKGPEDVEVPYAIAVAYVGWSDSQTICDGALNKELLKNEPNEHLPIFRMDTLEDLEQFKAQYENVFAMDQGFDNIRSFEAVLKQSQFDRELFYEDNSMLLIYIPANSGSLRFFVDEIITNDNSLCFSVGQKDNQEVVTDDMAGWMLLVKATKEELGKYTSFDAVLGK